MDLDFDDPPSCEPWPWWSIAVVALAIVTPLLLILAVVHAP